jgi:hypothetical protein
MPRGIVSFHGTTFDVRGIIQLRRRQSGMEVVHLGWNRIPERVESIPFGQRFGRLHALLGTDKPAPEGRTIGWLIWHYADGSQHSCLIDYGRHVRDYWTDHDPRTDTSQARLAWEGIDPVPNWGGPRTRLRVYQCYWDNPEPELEVVNFDFVSALTTSAPFLIAVTVE